MYRSRVYRERSLVGGSPTCKSRRELFDSRLLRQRCASAREAQAHRLELSRKAVGLEGGARFRREGNARCDRLPDSRSFGRSCNWSCYCCRCRCRFTHETLVRIAVTTAASAAASSTSNAQHSATFATCAFCSEVSSSHGFLSSFSAYRSSETISFRFYPIQIIEASAFFGHYFCYRQERI